MDLGTLIKALKEKGDAFSSWYGVDTNIELVGDVVCEDGKYKIELKVKEEK